MCMFMYYSTIYIWVIVVAVYNLRGLCVITALLSFELFNIQDNMLRCTTRFSFVMLYLCQVATPRARRIQNLYSPTFKIIPFLIYLSSGI